jgi:1-acyl-sn-glycerol-3-phosphate acyltransferase
LIVSMPVVGAIARSCGALHASPTAARRALAQGYDVACYPGGDIDSCRPFSAHRQVRFGGRRGYVRLALETGVPIVPIATVGSHFSYLVLPGAERVAVLVRALGAHRSRCFPVTAGLVGVAVTALLAAAGVVAPAWIAVAFVAAVVPTPVRITSEVLEPIDVRAATVHAADPAERIELAHRLVYGALSRAVATMGHQSR